MFKALALATLATLPLGVQSTVQPPPLIRADRATPPELAQEIMRLSELNDATMSRQDFLREELEINTQLRRAMRHFEDVERTMNRRVEDLETRLMKARTAIDQAPKPDVDHTPAHSTRRVYEMREEQWMTLHKEAQQAREERTRSLNDAGDSVAELEWQLKSMAESNRHEEEVARIEARIKRYLADQDVAEQRRRSRVEVTAPSVIQDDFRTARIAAAAAGSPLLVNFTAHTAVNARKMEVSTFKHDAVAAQLANFIEARLHADAKDDDLRADISERARVLAPTSATPVYVVLDPRSGRVLGRLEGASLDPAAFAEFLASSKTAMGGPQTSATSEQLWGRIFDLEDEVARLSANLKQVSGSNW